jgi:hypothetical protein
MANKAAPKKTKKEIEETKKRRRMILLLAILMVGIMLFGVLLQFISPSSLHNVGQTDNTQKTGNFNSIADALMDLPSNANYIRYVDLNASGVVTEWAMTNLANNMPNVSMFGAKALKDVLACFPYPTLGVSNVEDPQVVVLTDFGTGFDNASYQKTNIKGAEIRLINSANGFSTDSYPVVRGRKEYVAAIDNYMKSSTAANSAYSTYADLLQQANQTVKNAKFAVAGTSSSLGFGDRYYASVTPVNATMCDYKIVIHLNQTLNQTQMATIADRWQTGASLYGIDVNAPQFDSNYVVMSARGDTYLCLNDLVTNWGFIIG